MTRIEEELNSRALRALVIQLDDQVEGLEAKLSKERDLSRLMIKLCLENDKDSLISNIRSSDLSELMKEETLGYIAEFE